MKILLVGTGYMALEYAKVLTALNLDFEVVGRSENKCEVFRQLYPAIKCTSGGVEKFRFDSNFTHSIVASSIESLYSNVKKIVEAGVKSILLEKPGGKNAAEIESLKDLSKEKDINLLLAYNRRFYSSTIKASEMIIDDGGVSSFCFEFTEWAHTIKPMVMDREVKEHWFFANTTHVVDTAFFLGGKPTQLSAYHQGGLDWHPASSVFAGAGVSEKGALFSYHADWEAPGRWVIEILTKKRRLLFKPMEALQVQLLGSVAINPVEIDDTLDKEFKPGIYLQTKAFLDGDYSRFCTIQEQAFMIENFYTKMSGY